MRACGCGERRSLQNAIRGRKMSSAKRVWPVTFARASTRRRGTPITRRSFSLAFREPTRVTRGSLSFGIRPPGGLSTPTAGKSGCRSFLTCDLQHRGFDGFENLKVARAAAQVAGDGLADLISRGVRILIQQSFRCHQNCRRAIAALRGSQIGKGILQRMKTSVFPEAFHGQDLLSAALERQYETGKNGLAVQKNGASAAFTEFTAMLGAGMTEIFTQDLQQSLVRCKGDVCLFAVQHESYLRGLL